MASSSVSQESLEYDDFETAARRSRIRALRARTTSQPLHKHESTESADHDKPCDGADGDVTLGVAYPSVLDHESPTRCASRLKDKRGRPNHLHKGKTAKDKRKLREKRRSTGVVHLPSTESTGDSLDEEEKSAETRKNTAYNEVIDADNPQTPEEDRRSYGTRVRNKSPSDLEADLEDNQDYDSTVSQSETNLTTIGQNPAIPPSSKFSRMHTSPETRRLPGGPRDSEPSTRPVSYPSRFHEQEMELEHAATGELGTPPKHTFHHHPHYHHHHHHHHHRASRDSNGELPSRVPPPKDRWEKLDGAKGETQLLTKNKDLEKMLESEKEENRKLQELLSDRDRRIAQLEQEIALLNKRH